MLATTAKTPDDHNDYMDHLHGRERVDSDQFLSMKYNNKVHSGSMFKEPKPRAEKVQNIMVDKT